MPLLVPQVSPTGFNASNFFIAYPELSSLFQTTGNTKIAIVRGMWNEVLVSGLERACISELKQHNFETLDIPVVGVSELPYVCRKAATSGNFAAVIALGVMIKGVTTTSEIISDAVANSLTHLNIQSETKCPVINGVFTFATEEQAIDRCGLAQNEGKGKAVALAALSCLAATQRIKGL